MKKTVIISTIILLVLPFVLIKTIFPFYRFGMFAEPIQHTAQKEHFLLKYQLENKTWVIFDGTEVGLSKSVFAAKMRQAHYQQKESELIRKTASVFPKAALSWELWKIDALDSSRVEKWQP